MTTATQTLTDFLLARIAEDEASQGGGRWSEGQWHLAACEVNTYNSGDCDCGLPDRVLAQCAAFRAIVEQGADQFSTSLEGEEAMRLLAGIYRDHPDFDDAWLTS